MKLEYSLYNQFMMDWNALDPKILIAELLTQDTSWHFTDVRSSYNRLYLILGGDGYLKTEQGEWPMLPGHIYLIPAESCYTYGCKTYISKFLIHFTLELFPGTDLFSYFDGFKEISILQELQEKILSEVKTESLESLFRLKSIVWDILGQFFCQETKDSDYMRHFEGHFRQRLVLNYLSDHINAKLRIQDVAEGMKVPQRQLARSFRKDMGLSLKEYMEKILFQRACNLLLLHTDMSIYQIADSLGFVDSFYFSRFFKKKSGLSPRNFRKFCC